MLISIMGDFCVFVIFITKENQKKSKCEKCTRK